MEAPSPARGPHLVGRYWIPVVLLTLFAAQSLWFIASQSLTYDEPIHLNAGLEAWQNHAFGSIDHPPLPRLWSTAVLAHRSVTIPLQEADSEFLVREIEPRPEVVAWMTRPMVTLLGIALGACLWFAVAQLVSEGAANLALALFAFSPDLIAHFSLTTTDGFGTFFIFLGAWQLVRWTQRPDRLRTVQLGVCLGGMILSKFYSVPLVLLAVIYVIVSGGSPFASFSKWRWKHALAISGITLIVCWAGYFFHVSHLQIADGRMVIQHPNRPPIVKEVHWRGHLSLWVPAGELVDGVRTVTKEVHHGRPGWLLGKAYRSGSTHWYYPVAIDLKWPTVALLCFALGAVAVVSRIASFPVQAIPLFCFPVFYLAFALTSSYTIGVRHVLPLYPFMLFVAGSSWEWMKRWRTGVWIAVLLVCLNVADVLRYCPSYLSYFNVFVPHDQGWKDLSDSNIDWGQGLINLRAYQGSRSDELIHLAYFGSVDPKLYGILYEPLAPRQRATGIVAVSMSYLSGQTLDDPEGYRWLLAYKPVAVIDDCMFVYEIR